ncbi:hypothetical protein DFH06DRAFT_1018081, partial [Mycena polygramma]
SDDTMMEAIQRKCREAGIKFDAKKSRMRCTPHTVHLAALKLLEAVGALTKDEAKKSETRSRRGAYQETATQPDGVEADRNAEVQVNESDSEDEAEPEEPASSRRPTQQAREGISLAVYKASLKHSISILLSDRRVPATMNH